MEDLSITRWMEWVQLLILKAFQSDSSFSHYLSCSGRVYLYFTCTLLHNEYEIQWAAKDLVYCADICDSFKESLETGSPQIRTIHLYKTQHKLELFLKLKKVFFWLVFLLFPYPLNSLTLNATKCENSRNKVRKAFHTTFLSQPKPITTGNHI